MSLKLERGRVTFENAIITNTRTTNCFLILFPKQFLPKWLSPYTLHEDWFKDWSIGTVASHADEVFVTCSFPKMGRIAWRAKKRGRLVHQPTGHILPEIQKLSITKQKNIHPIISHLPPPPSEALTYYDVLKVNLRPVHAEWSWISNTAFEALVDHVIHFQ